MLNNVLRVNKVYPQFVHIVNTKDERDINRDDVKCYLSRSTTNREGKVDDFFKAGTFNAEVAD